MTHRQKAVLGVAAAMTLAVTSLSAQNPQAGPPKPAAVLDVLPKAAPSPALDRLKQQMQRMIAVRDSETGEFRAATPEEHAALTGASGSRASRTAATQQEDRTIQLPNGAVALPADLSQLDFMTIERHADGTLALNCNNPLHNHRTRPANAKVRNFNEQ